MGLRTFIEIYTPAWTQIKYFGQLSLFSLGELSKSIICYMNGMEYQKKICHQLIRILQISILACHGICQAEPLLLMEGDVEHKTIVNICCMKKKEKGSFCL